MSAARAEKIPPDREGFLSWRFCQCTLDAFLYSQGEQCISSRKARLNCAGSWYPTRSPIA